MSIIVTAVHYSFIKCISKALVQLWTMEAKSHLFCLFDFSSPCVFKCVLKLPAREDAYPHWLHLFGFSPLCFFKCEMCPQIDCPRSFVVTLAAFVWLFSTVCFRMIPQIARLSRCIVTLVAFVWLFSSVCFQMHPQMACLRWCITTLVAFFFFSAVSF